MEIKTLSNNSEKMSTLPPKKTKKKETHTLHKNRKGILKHARKIHVNLPMEIFAGCLDTTSNFSFRVINLFPHRLTSSFSLAQPTQPFIWLDASQDSTTGLSGISDSV